MRVREYLGVLCGLDGGDEHSSERAPQSQTAKTIKHAREDLERLANGNAFYRVF